MAGKSIKRRPYRCPGCDRQFQIPTSAQDPGLCPKCRKAESTYGLRDEGRTASSNAGKRGSAKKAVEIKVLSVKQPWADLILTGNKWCENRTWQTKHRGILFIHASKWDVPARRELEAEGENPAESSPGGCQTGAIVGFANLYGCFPIEILESIYKGRVPKGCSELARILEDTSDESWNYVGGPWCWVVCDTPRFLQTPIPAKGKLNVWKHVVEKSRLKPMRIDR